MQGYIAQLGNQEATALREATCSALADALAATGAVLWAFGPADQPRRAISAAIQMVARLLVAQSPSCGITTDMALQPSFAR